MDSHVQRLDPIKPNCFSYVDEDCGLLNLHLYAHANSSSSRVERRCIKTDKLLSHITMTARFPGECFVKAVN